MSGEKQTSGHQELLQLKGKLNALSAILRLGHEAFEKPNLEKWAIHVVNNSVLAVAYSRSALLDMRGGWPRIVAISGQPEVQANSEYCNHLINLAQPFRQLDKIVVINHQVMEERNVRKGAVEALNYLENYAKAIILVPLSSLGESSSDGENFLWVVEFNAKRSAAAAPSLLALLSKHYCESLFFILRKHRRKLFRQIVDRRKFFRPSRIIFTAFILFVIAMFVAKVRQNVSAEFEIIPEKENIYYAPFDGVIERCYAKSGQLVEPEQLIVKYDTEERLFKLATARNTYNKISAQLNQVQSASFTDISKRGNVHLLQLQKEQAAIDVELYQWYLHKSEIRAETTGILDIGDTSRLEGKAVHSGERLFEILAVSDDSLIALISLDEQNASVIAGDGYSVTLYLHTRPEVQIRGEIISRSPKPVFTERRTYCYLIRLKPENPEGLICGMRGVARIAGSRVSLGYYLFRNLVLWWRQV